MSSVLNNAASGLLAFQRAIATTSQNIANVNTEGYSRQRIDLDAVSPTAHYAGAVGRGVRVENIERLHNEFSTQRVVESSSAHAGEETHLNLASRLDSLVADEALGLTPALSNFDAALQDAAANPSSAAVREVLLGAGQALAERFSSMQSELDSSRDEIEQRMKADISEVNELALSVADLNRRITLLGTQGGTNEIEDQRDVLIGEIAKLIDIKTISQDNGAVDLAIGNGQWLVADSKTREMRVVPDATEPSGQALQIGSGDLWETLGDDVTTGGSVGGYLAFARDTLSPTEQRLGRLARVIGESINETHRSGIRPDGTAGEDWFDILDPQVTASTDNVSTASLNVIIDDTNSLAASDYEVRHDAGTLYVTRRDDGETFSGTAPISIDGLTIALDGTPADGDTYIVSANGAVASGITQLLSDPMDVALARRLSVDIAIENSGRATINQPDVTDILDPGLDNEVEITFTSDDTYDVIDTATGTALATGMAYTSGDDLNYNGWHTQIAGIPNQGDTFTISPGDTPSSDNGNALALSDLQDALNVEGTTNPVDEYASLVSFVGGSTRQLDTRTQGLATLLSEAQDRRDAVSGVNLDEEAVDLSRFTQAYQASAQVVATADTLFQNLLAVVAR